MPKFKPWREDQPFLLPPTLEEFVPTGHLARVVSGIVDELDTTDIERKYSRLGQNTYHPKIMLKLLFYGYAIGVRSGRKIDAACETDAAFMYLARMYRPDFRTINDFRKNHLPEIETYFTEIVRVCAEMGMAQVGTICIDGSKLKASASAKKTKDKQGYRAWLARVEKEIQEILKEAEETDRAEDLEYGEERGDELPRKLREKERLREKIKEAMRGLRGGDKANLTDPDARFMRERHGVIRPAYNCQLAVAEGQVIVAAEVTTRAVDGGELAPMLERAEENLGEKVETVVADAGYGSYDNYQYLKERGKEAYIPDRDFQQARHRSPQQGRDRYHKDHFTYHREKDRYICPEGKPLPFYKRRVSAKGKVARKQLIYRGVECSGCPQRELCTKQEARTVVRELREELKEEMRKKLLSEEGGRIYRKRMHTAEPPFGHLKHNLGYKSFLLRTLDKARGEFKLMCIGYNLTKIWRFRLAKGAV